MRKRGLVANSDHFYVCIILVANTIKNKKKREFKEMSCERVPVFKAQSRDSDLPPYPKLTAFLQRVESASSRCRERGNRSPASLLAVLSVWKEIPGTPAFALFFHCHLPSEPLFLWPFISFYKGFSEV